MFLIFSFLYDVFLSCVFGVFFFFLKFGFFLVSSSNVCVLVFLCFPVLGFGWIFVHVLGSGFWCWFAFRVVYLFSFVVAR